MASPLALRFHAIIWLVLPLGLDARATAGVTCPHAQSIAVTLERVVDGDTVRVRTLAQAPLTLRLAQIDAPESAQPWSKRSKQLLASLLAQGQICIISQSTDRYGRSVAQLYAGPIDVNREMIARGGAWAFRRYLNDRTLIAVEARARARRAGLWSMPDAEIIAPWDYRAARRSASTPRAGR